MRILIAAAVLATLPGLQGGSALTFVVGGSRFVVSNFSSGDLDGLQTGSKEKHFSVVGSLAKVFSPDQGFTALGKSMDFTITETDPKIVTVKSGLIDGSASIIFDSETADKAAQERAQKAGKPAPAPRPESSHIELHSERLTYSGSSEKGTLELPLPWTITDSTRGTAIKEIQKTPVTFDVEQELTVSGTKGVFDLGKDKTGKFGQLKTGVIEGPVSFSIVRKETPRGTSTPSVSRYTGVADRLVVDLTTSPGTLVARGHVVVDADTPEIKNAHFVEDQVTIELDDQMQPLRIRFGGSPAKTTVTPRGGGK